MVTSTPSWPRNVMPTRSSGVFTGLAASDSTAPGDTWYCVPKTTKSLPSLMASSSDIMLALTADLGVAGGDHDR